jgi:penicillin amidase
VLPFADSDVAAARDRLVNWGAQMPMNSPEAALYNMFWAQLVARTFDDQLPPGQSLGVGTFTSDIIYTLLQDPGSAWWDDVLATPAIVENREDILAQAFSAAYAEGVETLGGDMDKWRWGDLHTVTFRNASLGRSGIGLIENLFNRGPYPTSGSESVPQKTGWAGGGSYEVNSIPALRQVLDLGDLDNSRLIFSVGQSGHPRSDHYDDLIELWRTMQYHPSNWSRAAAEAGQFETLVLTPPEG